MLVLTMTVAKDSAARLQLDRFAPSLESQDAPLSGWGGDMNMGSPKGAIDGSQSDRVAAQRSSSRGLRARG